MSDNNLPFFGSEGSSLMANPFDLIVESLLLLQVTHLVFVSLVLEVVPLFLCECLPLLADLLHDLKCSHFQMSFNNQRTSLHIFKVRDDKDLPP